MKQIDNSKTYGIFHCYGMLSKTTEKCCSPFNHDEPWISDWRHIPKIVESEYFVNNKAAYLCFTGTNEECKKECHKHTTNQCRTTVKIVAMDDKSVKKNELSPKERLSGKLFNLIRDNYKIDESEIDPNDPLSRYNILNEMCEKMINSIK